MSDFFYLVNKTATNLHVKDFVTIPPYGYKKLHENDRSHSDVLWAVERDWATISETEPTEGEVFGKLEIAVPEIPMQGLTAEELKEHLAGKSDAVQVNVEKFGDKPTEKTSEPTAEAIGTEPQVQGEPKAEALGESTRTRKKKE